MAYPSNLGPEMKSVVGDLVRDPADLTRDLTGDLTVYVTGDVEIDVEELGRISVRSMNRVR